MIRDGPTKTYGQVKHLNDSSKMGSDNHPVTVVSTVISINMWMGGWWRKICFFFFSFYVHNGDETDGESAWWKERRTQIDEHVHAGAHKECHFPKKRQYFLRRGAPVPSREDESNAVLTLGRFMIQTRLLSPQRS